MSVVLTWTLPVILAFVGFIYATTVDASRVRISGYTAATEVAVAAPTQLVSGPAPHPAPAPAPAPPPPPTITTPLSAPPTDERLTVLRAPSIDPATIRRVLEEYNSPAAGEAQAMYDLGLRYGIDPAFCLAFFIVESTAGTRGVATTTRSVGNIRATPGYVNYKGYRQYATWRDGIEDWYELISRLYVGKWNLTTVEEIVPVYAPAEDKNDPVRYISTVRYLVHQWRAVK